MLDITPDTQNAIRQRLAQQERDRFITTHPKSKALAEEAAAHWLFGVPLHWMSDWSTPFALQVTQAQGATVTDVDGHRYIDFCLGDTGAMFGHASPPVVQAVQREVARGCTTMLSSQDSAWVGAELARRFGLPLWQSALSASDANRFLLRWVRAATGRKKLLVFNGCYHGTLLVLDETHTFSSGPGGYARLHGLQPDALVLGKPIAGGLPCAVYGMTAELAERAVQAKRDAPPGHSGIGTTLTANRLTMAAMRATLAEVATNAAFDHMISLCSELADGLRACISRHQLPWCVTQVGARCEFQFGAIPPTNGTQAEALFDAALEHLIHLALLNRGVLITPFHNMLLCSPATTRADVAHMLQTFDEVLARLTAAGVLI
ncbi:MAG: aminotransferase class III-fold pyridoxal phosphate-dependent enzyme [Parasulfuritortus sp.]|nr:aminotransferase class III-fold pyridoxal phosphate-dependent enzyme [Parasulfuritortus sp.]